MNYVRANCRMVHDWVSAIMEGSPDVKFTPDSIALHIKLAKQAEVTLRRLYEAQTGKEAAI
jgi:hypothetical protein